jgi:Xaa-Pro dipeptidase
MPISDLNDFPREEYQRRLDGLRALMAERGMDAVLVTTEANHRYFTGHVTHRWSHHYVAIFALLPLEGEPVLIVQPNEAYMCEADSWIETIRTFPAEHELQGVAALADAVSEAGLAEALIGTELGGMVPLRMPHGDFVELRQRLPRVDFVDASPLCWTLRVRKSSAEAERIRQSVAITDAAYQALFAKVKSGMSERGVYQLLAIEHLKRGAEMPGSITFAPHIPGDIRIHNRTLRRPTDRVLTAGELITQDAGGIYRGYWSDYTRMYALERASAVHKDAYRVAYDSLQAAIEATRPGVPIADLVHAAIAVMKAAGYAECAEQVTGIGHAMGLEVIEPPFISFENDVILEEGMVLTVEPGLFVGDAFCMLEEDVLVTDGGYEVLSAPASPELPVL